MTIQECITEIIEGIPRDKDGKAVVFDSRYVINQLIYNYHNEYLSSPSNDTATKHGLLAQEISNHPLVTPMNFESYSETIFRKGSTCALWKRK
jgi:hypothetical protein